MRLLILFMLSPFFLFSQTQIGNDIDGIAAGDGSGIVSFSGDGTIVAIGGPGNDIAGEDAGHVRVFENSSGNWVQIGNTILGKSAGDHFGANLSLSNDGSILAIGAPFNDHGGNNAGQVQVFKNISGTWTQIGNDILGDNSDDNFSRLSLSNDGTIVSVNGGYNKSYTRIYEYISDIWTQVGSDINAPDFEIVGGDGSVISGDGSVVAVSTLNYGCFYGSTGDGDCLFGYYYYNGFQAYKNISDSWTQIGNVQFGYSNSFSLSNNGNILAASLLDGSVRVYQNIANSWTQIGDSILADYGSNLNLSSDGSIVSISGYDDTGSEAQGFVRVYKNESGTWNQKGDDIIGEGLRDWLHNISLSSNGDKIAIGSANNDGNGIDSGHVRVYDLSALLSSDDFILPQFSLFPNPAKDQFTITLNKSIELDRINIYNQLAQLINSTKVTTVNTSLLSSGMYYVEVITNQGKATKKLIIE